MQQCSAFRPLLALRATPTASPALADCVTAADFAIDQIRARSARPRSHPDSHDLRGDSEAGQGFQTILSEKRRRNVGLQSGDAITHNAHRVTDSLPPVTNASLAGSGSRFQPAGAHLAKARTALLRRRIFYPDIGFGLETRVIDASGRHDPVLTARAPKG